MKEIRKMTDFIMGDVDDPVTLLSEKEVKARKEHKCYECGEVIPVMAHYWREVYVFEGEITSHKTCLVCKSIRDVFFCDGWAYHGIREALEDHLRDTGVEDVCFGKDILELTPEAKETVLALMDELTEGEC